MPVQMRCSCGKLLRVPDEYAGKKVKCPGCGNVQTVGAAAESAAKPAPRPAAAPANMIRFNCVCGKQMQAKSEHAGATIQCPACGDDVVVPDPSGRGAREEGGIQAGRSAGRGSRDPDLDFEDEEDRPRRGKRDRKKSGGKPLWPWIAAAGLLLLLIGGGVAGWMWWRGGSASAKSMALIPANAQGFVTVRVKDVWQSQAVTDAWQEVPADAKQNLSEFEGKVGLTIGDIDRVTVVVKEMPSTPRESPVIYMIVATNKAYDIQKIKAAIEEESKNTLADGTYKGKTYLVGGKGDDKGSLYSISDTILVVGTEKGVQACIDQEESPVTSGPLADAIDKASGSDHILAAISPPQELLQQIPGGGPPGQQNLNFDAFKKLQLGTIVANLTGALDLKVILAFADGGAAGEAKTMLDGFKGMASIFLMQAGAQNPAAAQMAQKALGNLKIEQADTDVTLSMQVDLDKKTIQDALQKMLPQMGAGMGGGAARPGGQGGIQGAANKAMFKNNLKQIGLAMHSYHDNMRHLPQPAILSPNGQPLLSWRVAILPYIEQDNLYRQIHLNEPWDSEHNRQFWSQMPKTYELPGTNAGPGMTFIQVFNGKDSLFPGRTKVGFGQVQDGLSNTIMAVEAATPVNWMAPRDVGFASTPLGVSPRRLGGHFGSEVQVLMADGSVGTIPQTTSAQTLQAAITASGGEILPPGFPR